MEPNRIHGVSQPLPPGEVILWEGSPSWRAVARHALRVRWVAGYFGAIVLAGFLGAKGANGAEGVQMVLGVVMMQVALAAFVVGIICAYAVLTARGTVYAITDRRVVMKVGVVLPTTINIPFRLIEAADLRMYRDGTGAVVLRLSHEDRIGYVHLWPHVRPWRMRHPEPTLIGLSDPVLVGKVVAGAVAASGAIVEPVDAAPATAEPERMAPRHLVPAS